jgi:Protein of unknown function (DUF2510)
MAIPQRLMCDGCGKLLQPGKAPSRKERKALKQAPEAVQAQQQTVQGWYPDMADLTLVRWFDGQQWTEHVQPRR